MTKEEVAQVIAYCDENKISYKQRLTELGISPWSFYDAKRKYAPKEEGDNAGEFLQLILGGSFLPNPIKPSRSRPADIPVWLAASRERLLRAPHHGHYAFGSVAKEKSGVGRKSATSVGLTTDLVHWLQAGKTVAVVRFASKFHRLASAFRTAS